MVLHFGRVTHARDFAKALLGMMSRPTAIGEAYHIMSDEVLTWNQIYNQLAGLCRRFGGDV